MNIVSDDMKDMNTLNEFKTNFALEKLLVFVHCIVSLLVILVFVFGVEKLMKYDPLFWLISLLVFVILLTIRSVSDKVEGDSKKPYKKAIQGVLTFEIIHFLVSLSVLMCYAMVYVSKMKVSKNGMLKSIQSYVPKMLPKKLEGTDKGLLWGASFLICSYLYYRYQDATITEKMTHPEQSKQHKQSKQSKQHKQSKH